MRAGQAPGRSGPAEPDADRPSRYAGITIPACPEDTALWARSLAKDALGVAESGKGLYSEGKGLYDWLMPSSADSTMATSGSEGYASGGLVYDAHPDLTEGPEPIQMPVAKLNAPELSFSSSGQNTSGGLGIGDAVKSAAGLAGAAKTLWDVGSTVGPALMALSDRRLKTGVSGYDSGGRVGYADDGGVDPPDFDEAVKDTFRYEGGLNPRDTNGTPSNYGINQKANPDVDVCAV